MTATLEPFLGPATAAPTSVVSISRNSTIASFSRFPLSRSEKRYIEDGIFQSYRTDGRGLLDYRPFTVTVGVLPSASGSARVQTSGAELVVGIKCEVLPVAAGVDSGLIECGVECSASDKNVDVRASHDAALYLAKLIEQLCLNSAVIDRRKLCILPGHFVWKVFVDVVILNSGGNVVDAATLGVRAALLNTLLPYLEHNCDVDAETGKEIVDFEVDQRSEEQWKFEMCYCRPEMGNPFPSEDVPVCITLGEGQSYFWQIKGRFVWDLSPQEETCASNRIIVAVDAKGRCRGIHKAGQPLNHILNTAVDTLLIDDTFGMVAN